MAAGSDFSNHQLKQQAQYLNMRGAQIAQEKAGQTTTVEPASKVQGTKKQLIGTIVGVIAVIAVLVLWSILR